MSLYWHTVKYLKPIQLFVRIWLKYYHPKPDLRPAPNLTDPTCNWVVSACRLPSISKANKFSFLNIDGDLSEIGWDGPQREKLWRYNQHYFDDLNSINSDDRKGWHKQLIQDWINCNPPGFGTGWEPYPVSLRIVNLVKWVLRKNKLSSNAKQSLAIQLRWLSKRLEVHLLGNHLFSNAKALVFGGLFFEGKEADGWLGKGFRILSEQIPVQILDDGGHFELSTMYHALAFEDLLDLINVTKCFSDRLNEEQNKQISSWYGIAEKMHFWLDTMCHPDGEISFFNDSAFDIAPSKSELDAYAKRLGIVTLETTDRNLILLKDSGYIRIKNDSALALLDVAKIGPDYLPGHGHADTLSFELSVGDQRVIVNSGTSCYGLSTERLKQRGTLSHNTVTVNGENSSEVWGGFRVAKRAYPRQLKILNSQPGNNLEVRCSHNGYDRLKGKPVHTRSWYMNERELLIKDNVLGYYKTAEARFHFHPDIQVTIKPNHKSGTVLMEGNKILTWFIDDGFAALEESFWYPKFGMTVPNFCLQIKLVKGVSVLRLRFSKSEFYSKKLS